jgi:hypothetical protein
MVCRAGVGNKTTLENIQISFFNDDSFECYGGKTTLSNIISYRSTDDDFDFNTQAKILIVLPLEIHFHLMLQVLDALK